jgi:CRISPR-associated protein Cmr3
MLYKIKPLETLFFRDGSPFTMGAETVANFVFPPYPSIVYGAIRSWLISERGGLTKFYNGEFETELGTPQKKGNLKVKGIFVGIVNVLYFQIPQDLLQNEKELKSLNFVSKSNLMISDYELENALVNKSDELLEEPEGFIDVDDLIRYLKEGETTLKSTHSEKIYMIERKIGIKRNIKTLTSEEKHLYSIPMIRMKENASLFVEIDGLNDYPKRGLIKIGGEGKTCEIERCEEDLLKDLKDLEFDFENNMFKCYLATPAIFEKGWLPKWIDEENLEGEYEGVKVKVIGCSIGKYNFIGGWDIAKKEPKLMYKAVPAGSVYYFKVLNGVNSNKIKEVFHLKNISDVNPEEGFGLNLIGKVK